MFRKQIFSKFSESRNYSKCGWPIKETVCPSKSRKDKGPISSDKVVCSWKKTKSSKPMLENLDLEFNSKWKSLTLYLCLPIIILMTGKVLLLEHDESRPEFVPYQYLRIRKTKFPWGDGNKTFFHNPHKNALPDGYED